MKRRMWISSATLCAFVIGITAAILYFGQVPKASKQEAPVAITNETEHLQVVSSKMMANTLNLVIKNTGDRRIISYHLDWDGKEGLTGDLSNTGGLAPGAELTVVVPLSKLGRDTNTGLYKLNIAMAFFEEGDAEGDWDRAQIQRDKIIGAALAASLIQKEIESVSPHSKATAESLVGNLKRLGAPREMNKWRRVGYYDAVARAYGQAERMRQQAQSPEKIEKEIIELRKSIDRQAALGRNFVEEK